MVGPDDPPGAARSEVLVAYAAELARRPERSPEELAELREAVRDRIGTRWRPPATRSAWFRGYFDASVPAAVLAEALPSLEEDRLPAILAARDEWFRAREDPDLGRDVVGELRRWIQAETWPLDPQLPVRDPLKARHRLLAEYPELREAVPGLFGQLIVRSRPLRPPLLDTLPPPPPTRRELRKRQRRRTIESVIGYVLAIAVIGGTWLLGRCERSSPRRAPPISRPEFPAWEEPKPWEGPKPWEVPELQPIRRPALDGGRGLLLRVQLLEITESRPRELRLAIGRARVDLVSRTDISPENREKIQETLDRLEEKLRKLEAPPPTPDADDTESR